MACAGDDCESEDCRAIKDEGASQNPRDIPEGNSARLGCRPQLEGTCFLWCVLGFYLQEQIVLSICKNQSTNSPLSSNSQAPSPTEAVSVIV